MIGALGPLGYGDEQILRLGSVDPQLVRAERGQQPGAAERVEGDQPETAPQGGDLLQRLQQVHRRQFPEQRRIALQYRRKTMWGSDQDPGAGYRVAEGVAAVTQGRKAGGVPQKAQVYPGEGALFAELSVSREEPQEPIAEEKRCTKKKST